MADSTPTHNEHEGFVVKFKDGFESPIANAQKAVAQAVQNLPELDASLPLSADVDTSAMDQWVEENNQYRLQKERQDNNRFWMNFWLSVAAFIVAVASLIISLRQGR